MNHQSYIIGRVNLNIGRVEFSNILYWASSIRPFCWLLQGSHSLDFYQIIMLQCRFWVFETYIAN